MDILDQLRSPKTVRAARDVNAIRELSRIALYTNGLVH